MTATGDIRKLMAYSCFICMEFFLLTVNSLKSKVKHNYRNYKAPFQFPQIVGEMT